MLKQISTINSVLIHPSTKTLTKVVFSSIFIMNEPLLNPTGEVICPHCTGKTKKKFGYEFSPKQHLLAVALCLCVCLAPFFWIPYCINDWKDIKYSCHICGGKL